ncbi:WD40/YVTN/BNR-like repeat-containing protein [Aromatoleum buckelii]|uniref:Photosynthesis system II assembly factor Ycf48/Hcf136-like domain-containing protein n=1 Tax=Aromatoleum buckelii TaxID=200254 RepID=A0ABX1N3X8_9RHOO|nr:YCF48-related protein [Aromatoleum buckelii]MCK0511477.1 YCF48-related protein [Aromatoleum buckelii]
MNIQAKPWYVAVLGVSLCATLVGCGVSASPSNIPGATSGIIKRSDAFQAAADNGKTTVVVGATGVVLTSVDRGNSWSRHQLDPFSSFVGVAACADGSFAALDFFHRVWIADAAGDNWQARTIEEPANPLAITCDGKGRLWVVGSGSTIASSTDRGATWNTTVVGDDAMLASVQFIDEREGFVTGEFGAVYRTGDAGMTWEKLAAIGDDFYPYAAVFADSDRGWVSGLAGVVMQTTDGGKSWSKRINDAGAPIYGLVLDSGNPVGVGVNGLVFRLSDDEWKLADAHKASYLRAVLPLGDGRLLLAGGAGSVEITSSASGKNVTANN